MQVQVLIDTVLGMGIGHYSYLCIFGLKKRGEGVRLYIRTIERNIWNL